MTYDFDGHMKMLDGALDAGAIAAMREAFEAALREFQDSDEIRELIAERIVARRQKSAKVTCSPAGSRACRAAQPE